MAALGRLLPLGRFINEVVEIQTVISTHVAAIFAVFIGRAKRH